MIDFHEVIFNQSKSSVSQLRKFQYVHFKNLNKLKPIWIQMVHNIAVSRRLHMLGKNSKSDWLLTQLISLHKLTQLLTNQPKIGFLFDIYALNLYQLDNVIIQWLIAYFGPLLYQAHTVKEIYWFFNNLTFILLYAKLYKISKWCPNKCFKFPNA